MKRDGENEVEYSLFDDDWLRMSARERMIGSRVFLAYSCWWRCRRSRASFTLSLTPTGNVPELTIWSQTKSATTSRLMASMSSMTVPLSSRPRSSKSECSESVATCGLDQRLPPSSTSSSNLIQRAVSFHSISLPSLTSMPISEKSGCDTCEPSSTSSPRMNCTRCAGGVATEVKEGKRAKFD